MKSYLFGAVSVLSLVAAGAASANDHNDEGWYLRGNALILAALDMILVRVGALRLTMTGFAHHSGRSAKLRTRVQIF